MLKFIELTTLKNNSIIHLNPCKIVSFEKDTTCTFIICEGDNTYFVKETPEEIKNLIFSSQPSYAIM